MNKNPTHSNFHNWHLWLMCFFIPTLLMMPVLIWPHYGLFSDAHQIIEIPRRALASLPAMVELLRPLEDGRWNPMFHALSIAIYAIAPDSARAFYVMQWFFFIVICFCIAWVIKRLTGNVLLAILGLLLFCTASSVFENFYTLDKVEPRIVFFAALFMASFLPTISSHNQKHPQLNKLFFVVVQIISGIGIVFSKETGVFLASALSLSCIALFFNKNLTSAIGRALLRTTFIQITIVIAYIVLFKLLSPPMSYRYVSYDVSFALIIENVGYYLRTSPELAIGLVFASYWSLTIFFSKSTTDKNYKLERLLLPFLSIALFIYFSGICIWRWPLDYYLLPAHFLISFLIPLSLWAWSPFVYKVNRSIFWIFTVVTGIIWLVYFVYRVLFGVAIFHFDAIKEDLAHLMSNPNLAHKRVVLPFIHPQSFEVGERLEFFINAERPLENYVNLYNFWELPFLNRQNLHRFDKSAGPIPNEKQLIGITKNPERFVIWRYLQTSGKWESDYLKTGDLVLVPVGSKLLSKINARGISMHAKSTEEFLKESPIEIESIAQVRRNLASLWLGWELFEIKSFDTSEDSGGYSTHMLKVLNDKTGILPMKSTQALFNNNELQDFGVFLGNGWYDTEYQNDRYFRWTGNQSQIVLTRLPEGHCSVSMHLEPLMDAQSKPLRLNWRLGLNEGNHVLTSEKSLQFDFYSSGASVQILKLSAEGGMQVSPENDPRLLKMRVFNIGQPSCSKFN